MPSKTILFGDELANGLDKALRALPDTLPLWTLALPGWPILPAAAEGIASSIKKIDDEWQKRGGDPSLTKNIVVSAGRNEILGEPDDASSKDYAEFADDIKKVAEKLKAQGNVFWILPPAVTGERKARALIAKTLQDAGVRVLDASQFAADPKANRDKPAPADLPDEAYSAIAKRLKSWIPIGPTPFSNLVVTPASATSAKGVLDKAKAKSGAAFAAVSSWSGPAKIAGGAVAAAVVLGSIYAVSRPRQRPRKNGRES